MRQTVISGLVEHLEKFIARIEQGETFTASESSPRVQVVAYEDSPSRTWGVFTTLGLSDHVHLIRHAQHRRMELVVFWDVDSRDEWDPALLLATIAGAWLEKPRSLSLGDVIPLPGPIAQGSILDHVYVTLPFLLPEEFETFHASDGPVIFPLLLPITAAEADFVRSHDAFAFEAHLDDHDVPILNPCRPSTM